MGPKIKNPSKFAKAIFYPLGAIFFIIAFFIIVLFAKGYWFYFKDGKLIIEKTGIAIIATRPGEGRIFLDGKDTGHVTSFPFLPVKINNLASGNYKLTVKRDGYRTWENTIKIQPDYVTWTNYILLFPNDLKLTKVDPLEGKSVIAQSQNNRYLFLSESQNDVVSYYTYDTSSGNLTKIWPKKTEPTEAWLKTPQILSAEFSQNADRLILRIKNGDNTDFAVLDTNGTDGKITSFASFYGTNFERVTADPTDSSYVFAFNKNEVYRLNLTSSQIPSPLAQNVIDFKPEKNSLVYFVQSGQKDSSLKSVSFDGSRAETIAKAIVTSDSYKFSYSSSESALLVLPNQEKTLMAYFTTNNQPSQIEFGKNVSDFQWSPNGRYIYWLIGNNVHHYDWEKKKETIATIADGIKNITWFYDEDHYLVTSSKELYEVDFDNTNKVVFTSVPEASFLNQNISSLFIGNKSSYQKFTGSF